MQIYKFLFSLIFISLSSQVFADYTLPKYEKFILDNGLTIYLMEQHEVPLIDVNIVIKAGAVDDNKLRGLAYLTAQNLVLGTKQYTKAQLNEAVAFIGAELSTYADLESSLISSSFAKKDLQNMLTLLQEVILSPRFEQQEFNKYKTQHLLRLEQAKESPKSVINNYFNRLIFGENGYGSIISGSQKSVQKIKLSNIKHFYNDWYQPQNAAIVVVGDFKSKTMLKQLKKRFSTWQNTQPVNHNTIKIPQSLTAPNVLLVNKDDAIESTFMIGGLGIAKNNPDRVGISVINTILGGRFTSWLNDALRVNSGLTYGARSHFASYSKGGTFAISTFTKTSTTIEAIDLALDTYARLWQQGIDEQTLASAKAYVKGKFPPKFETSEDLSALLAQMYAYNFDESYINTFEQQVNSLTLAKTKQLINRYFPKENLQMVIIGKAAEIKDKVKKYGKLKQVNIKAAGFNLP